MTAIMLDLETWGKRPGCDLRSIGACVMDLTTGYVATPDHAYLETFYVATDNPVEGIGSNNKFDANGYRRYKLHRDPETVQWWSEQSTEAQAAFGDAVDLREALERFDSWLGSLFNYEVILADTDAVQIYTHGPQFDISILAEAYHACGLPVPWHYRAPRDTRTLMDAADVGDHSAWLQQHNTGTVHHALDDAVAQAKAMCAAQARIDAWKRDAERYAWLRDGNGYVPEEQFCRGGEDLDKLCDTQGEWRG